MKILYVVMNLILFFLVGFAHASPQSLTYQGRIMKSDGTPLEYNNVSFIFQITDSTGQCLLYQEQVNGINMENSNGVFDVSIGQGTVVYPTSGSFSILDAFNNSGSFTCQGGVPYIASVTDSRKLRVQFHDGVGWKLISPDSTIRSVPFAGYSISAQKLGNNVATDFVLKTGIPTCANGTFLSWDGMQLSCQAASAASAGTVTNVTSANAYITITNGASTPQIALNVGTTANTVASGNDARLVNAIQVGAAANGDLAGTYPGPTVIALQGVPVSSTTPTMGHFLKFNGTNWLSSAIAISDVTNLSTQLSGYMTQAAFNTSIASASCSVSQTMYWNSVSGNFQCQSINVGLVGDVTGSIGAAKVVALQNNPVDTTNPTNGQVLEWDGSKWAPTTLPAMNPGTVTNVSGTAPISIATGTSTPVVSISQATTSTNGYLSSTDWNTFNNKQAAGNYVTALTGDVTASGPGPAAATVAKLQGSTLTLTSPADKDYLKFNGTAFVNSPLLASDLSGTISAANLPAFTGDVTSSVGSSTLTLAAAGTAGTYYKVTTDSKGRVTSGSAALIAADIPNLDWSKITSGTPTTLSGYGITDSLVKNGGGVGTMSSGVDASKPASPATGDLFVATDTQKIYRYNGASWDLVSSAGGSGGTITGVTAGTGLTGGGTSGAVTVNVNAGTAANQIVQLDGSAKLPAVDGSQLTNFQASQIPNLSAAKITSGTLAVAQGGTGESTYTDGQLLIGNTATSGLTKSTLTAGSGVSITNTNGAITIAATGSGGTVTNVTGTSPISVAAGSSTPVVSIASGSATGQTLRWDSTNWSATKLLYTDLVNATSSSPWPAATCTSGQAVIWSSVSDAFACSTLSIATSQLTGTLAAAQMPAYTGDVTSSAGSTTLTLANSGATAGTYKSVTVDAKGRVTAGTNPTTLSGYGITDSLVKNGGGVGTMSSGVDASKPASPATGDLFVATDTQKIYRYNGASWDLVSSAGGSGGTVTNVTGTSPISVATGSSTPVVSIQKADATHDGYLAQADWSIFNNKLGTSLSSGKIWVGSGSSAAAEVTVSGDATLANTGALSIANNAVTTAKMFANPGINRLVATDGTTGSNLAAFTCAVNETLTWSVANGWQCTAQSSLSVGTATNFSGNLAGDVSGTQSATTVQKIQGRSVASTAPSDGQVLKWNGTSSQWQPATSAGTGTVTWIQKSSNYTAVANDHIFADTFGGAFTVTLPASPNANDTVTIVDSTQNFSANNLTIGFNGQKLAGKVNNTWGLSTQGTSITLTYQDATVGWVVTNYMAVSTPYSTATYWNPSDKDANMILSNNNLDVTKTGASWGTVRANTYRSSGSYYYEIKVVAINSGTPAGMFGIANSSATLGSYLGADSGGLGYQVQGSFTYGATYTGSKPAFALNDVCGIAVDFTAGTLKIYKNNVYQGQFTTLPPGNLYPGGSIGNSDTTTKLRLVTAGANQTYSPPAGYSSWD
ncbi:beta strand repeat-containing protein [Bdellovibrio svalbardensis]|uniref:B30.2/SPRY domain-containing protein n=1 Tax=Bdellovibrio svalbardensis TaxID=2972972 RepID=A0ABT6DLB4_9BACT|nr:SPRY domain-containing protein [Bdellovibrio svalbardensis]MDG0817665.1 hypothetical protein [Bdellovibrio svalbardensis]